MDKCGNHPLQKLISYTSSEEEYNLIIHSFIKDTNKLLTASLDKYGSYVIQKIIEHIPEKYRNLFNLIYIKHLCLISKQKFGVVGAKLFLSNTKNEKNINQIINVIRNDFLNLAKNEYGIYLLNHIIEKMHNTNLASEIKKEIMDNFADLFYNKNCFNQICYPFLNKATLEEKFKLMNILNLKSNNNNIQEINHIIQFIANFKNKNNNFSNMNRMNQMSQMSQMNQMNQMNQMSQMNQMNQIPLPFSNFVNNQNNFINQNQLPISLNNFNNNNNNINNNFMNQNMMYMRFNNNFGMNYNYNKNKKKKK